MFQSYEADWLNILHFFRRNFNMMADASTMEKVRTVGVNQIQFFGWS